MIVELEPVGRESIARVQLTNDSTKDIPYEIRMMRGIISPQGELELVPADEDFLVFPAQALVEQKSQQVFRIQYVSDAALDQSQTYYMSIQQVPVAYQPGVSQVQVVVNYNVLINVVPDGSEPLPAVRSYSSVERKVSEESLADDGTIATTEQTVKGLEVDLANDGNRFFLAGMADWKITGKTVDGLDFEREYEGEDMSKVIGVGVVAPGRNRIFLIPMEEELMPETVSISISF